MRLMMTTQENRLVLAQPHVGCAEEDYELHIPPREDRRNEITEVLDELRR
jgi:hypothetical protein